jgi:hypothetical protein
MKFLRGMKRKVRKFGRIARKTGRVLHKVTGVAEKAIKFGDKYTGGALTSAISSDPRGRALLTGLHTAHKITGMAK